MNERVVTRQIITLCSLVSLICRVDTHCCVENGGASPTSRRLLRLNKPSNVFMATDSFQPISRSCWQTWLWSSSLSEVRARGDITALLMLGKASFGDNYNYFLVDMKVSDNICVYMESLHYTNNQNIMNESASFKHVRARERSGLMETGGVNLIIQNILENILILIVSLRSD